MSEPGKGIKFDAGKPRMSLLAYGPLAWLSRAMEQGLLKYTRGNWQQLTGEDNRYRMIDALGRHVGKFIGGEWLDQESKLPHLAHAMANCMMLLWHHDAVTGDSPDKLTPDQAAAMDAARLAGEAARAAMAAPPNL
jgi:hypothetical protein